MLLKYSAKIFKSRLLETETEKWNRVMTVSVEYPDTRHSLNIFWITTANKIWDMPFHFGVYVIYFVLSPFHTTKKKHRFLATNFTTGIVYLIIPRLTAFASFHTTQCNNSTNVPRDECTDIAGYH